MKNSKKFLGGLFAIAVATVAIVTASSASAYRGDPSVKGPDYTAERHDAMTKAFQNKDYAAWAKLMDGKGRVTKVVNANNFAKFAEAHDLAAKGDLTKSKAIRTELGLGLKDGSGNKDGSGQGQGRSNGLKDGSGAGRGYNK